MGMRIKIGVGVRVRRGRLVVSRMGMVVVTARQASDYDVHTNRVSPTRKREAKEERKEN